ncbi:transcriptional regulator [Acrocarpospora pleiomorpha]|uniref:Transcriptional regulator n=1 Tax=Acrocarpospora pleiomorpha TaxID=90975 RepID=A0A5M3XEL4_9ACTN|nr:ROK family transcriptional regulator [Acrocarpospora pleiomorpha]GES19192.1 transcriptional regulator [Acrocarpospora pleiomorpha]
MAALDPKAMRQANADTVLGTLYEHSVVSLAQLSARTGLSRRTVELILADLEERDWIQTHPPDPQANGRGRPARLFSFRDDAGMVLGVDIAHGHCAAAVADLRGVELARRVLPVHGEPGRAERLALAREAIAQALGAVGLRPGQIGAVGVATPGNVDDQGMVAVRLSMRDWMGVRLGAEFAADFSCPIHVENDAKLAALAELREGATPGADHMLWLMLEGRNNGLGIVVNGTPFRGVDGAAGEIFWAKALGLDDLMTSPLIGLGRLQPEPRRAEATALLTRAHTGDPTALAEVHRFAAILTRALSTLSWMLAPRHIVLGGSLTWAFGDLLTTTVKSLLTDAPPFVTVHHSALGDSAVIRGTIHTALDHFDWTTTTPVRLTPR